VLPTAYITHPASAGTDIRAELGVPPAAPIVATVAVLRPQKAIEVLLDAQARVREHIPEAHLVIAGDGECRQFLEGRARDLGLSGHVHFLGRRGDVDAIVAAADVAALSSDFEGMPLFMFECMANRTPLIATAVGGLPSVIESGSSGILVPPRNPAALAGALRSLLLDPVRREQIANAAYRRLAPFQIEVVAGRFAELYERLLKDVVT
jgi:glycosyltransferase involved in cell wall biosynthesis